VASGGSQTFTITPASGYQIASVSVDGANQGAISSYAFTNVVVSHTITASFTLIPIVQYTITVTQGTNGTISPGTTSVNNGGSQTFTITPTTNYQISSVSVDGVNQGAISSYAFTNVTATHTITATFTPQTYTVDMSKPYITSITPTTVSPGSIITINGGNFNNSWSFFHFQRNDSGLGYVRGYAYVNDSCGGSYVNGGTIEVSNINIVSWSNNQIQIKIPTNYYVNTYSPVSPSCTSSGPVFMRLEIPTVWGRAPICEVDSCAQFCTTDTCYREVTYNTAKPTSYLADAIYFTQ
jgi:hypothetical protein